MHRHPRPIAVHTPDAAFPSQQKLNKCAGNVLHNHTSSSQCRSIQSCIEARSRLKRLKPQEFQNFSVQGFLCSVVDVLNRRGSVPRSSPARCYFRLHNPAAHRFPSHVHHIGLQRNLDLARHSLHEVSRKLIASQSSFELWMDGLLLELERFIYG